MIHRFPPPWATSLVLLAGLVVAGPAAHADLVIQSVVGGVPTGVSYATFNDLPIGSTGGDAVTTGANPSTINVSFEPDAMAVRGSSALFAPPYLSNGNGAPFGAANGADTSTYLTTGLGLVTLKFSAPEIYLGLLWGSVDGYNSLQFFNGNTPVGTVTGDQVTSMANGNQGANGTYYVNINSTLAFDKVVASSSQYAFEFDDVAFNPTAIATPEPSTIVGAVAALPLGLAWFWKRRKQAGRKAA